MSTKRVGERKTVAAAFLRRLAEGVANSAPVRDREQVAADIRLVADQIEGKARWGKAGKYSPYDQGRINFYASMLDAPAHRLPGQSLSQALDHWADECAKALHREHELDAKEDSATRSPGRARMG